MKLLFGRLITISFLIHHFDTPLVSLLSCVSISFKFVPVAAAVVSSANSSNSSHHGKNRGRSLICSKKHNGPSMDPWGTPVLIGWGSDSVF